MKPKYALDEIERRWLVAENADRFWAREPFRVIEDRYVDQGRLRLRKVTRDGVVEQYKLCKKYGPEGGYAEPITNLYLSAEEYTLLMRLPGRMCRKRRYVLDQGSIDEFDYPLHPAMFSVEFEDEAQAARYVAPEFAGREVSRDPGYTGAAIAQTRRT